MEPKLYQEWLVDKRSQEKIKLLRTVSIFESEAESQNSDIFFTGLKYIAVEEAKKTADAVNPEDLKAKLWETINSMELDGVSKPHHASGVEKLQAFIDEHKK